MTAALLIALLHDANPYNRTMAMRFIASRNSK